MCFLMNESVSIQFVFFFEVSAYNNNNNKIKVILFYSLKKTFFLLGFYTQNNSFEEKGPKSTNGNVTNWDYCPALSFSQM